MSDSVTVERESDSWTYGYRMGLMRNAPSTIDPETGLVIDPVTGKLEFQWYGEWVLVKAEVSGLEILEEGEEHGEKQITCVFLDPLGADPDDGRAPDWILAVAQKQLSRIPVAPEVVTARG